MIELLIAGAGLAWLGSKAVNSGDKAVKGAVRSAKRAGRDVAAKAETVLQPCAAGRAPHKRMRTGETYADGTEVFSCRVCGRSMS